MDNLFEGSILKNKELKNRIELPGVLNSRELGGFPVESGYIKRGSLIRTGTLKNATPEAIQLLRDEYRVQTIIDFRMENERLNAPDPVIDGVEYLSFPVVEIEDYISLLDNPELIKNDIFQSLDRETMIQKAIENGLIGPKMYSLYLLGKRGSSAYRRFFEVLLDKDPENGAILWHCSDGKDRAGLASALLLGALGASRDTIMEDYLLTNEYNAHIVKSVKEKYASLEIDPERLNALIFVAGGVVKEYLVAALDSLESKFNGINGYITQVLDIKENDIAHLRDKFVQR